MSPRRPQGPAGGEDRSGGSGSRLWAAVAGALSALAGILVRRALRAASPGGPAPDGGRGDDRPAPAQERPPPAPAPDPVMAAAAQRRIAVAFVLSAGASLGLTVVYILGGQPQAEGALLFVSLGGIGYGLVEWAKHLMPGGPAQQSYQEHETGEAQREEVQEAFGRGEETLRLRRLLLRALGAAGGAFGVAALFPIRSLGPAPGNTLRQTAWRRGARMVTDEGRLVRAGDLKVGGILTVFPEGHTDANDSQTLLIRVEDSLSGDIPGGLVAYSKICTHAGCPVGLYRNSTHELFCPCHQSAFDVLRDARPIAGPATRPLPRLPIAIDDGGFVVATSDFGEPVGPAFWNRDRK